MQPKTRKGWYTVKGQKQTNCNITSIKRKCQSLSNRTNHKRYNR